MPRLIAALLALVLTPTVCLGGEGDDQANSFAKIYASLCMKNLLDLEALRTQLKPMPKLPPDKAALFLAGHPGDAWPVPDKSGLFVLSLPAGKSFCSVHVRRANTATVIKLFTQLVANPPSPLTAKLLKNEQKQTALNGPTQTISYEWSVPNAKRTMMFTLTTASSNSAQLQVLGSAAMISR